MDVRRAYNNTIAVLIVIAILALIFLLGGCTIYKIKSVRGEDGLVTTDVSVYSSRKFEQPQMAYSREGTDASFQFGAESADQPGPNDYATALATGVAAGMAAVTRTPPPD